MLKKAIFEKDLLKRVAKAVDAQDKGDDQPEADVVNTNAVDGETATQQVLGRIFSVPSDSRRGIMFLNDADLKDRYLTSGGEQKIASSAADHAIAAMFPHADLKIEGTPDQAFFFIDGGDFDLSHLDKPAAAKRPYAVLFNIPKPTATKFSGGAPANMDEARELFKSCISHGFYVATLNEAAIKKAGVGALDDRAEREEQFNIKKFITAYPIRATIDAAREEQDERDQAKKLTPTEKPAASDEEGDDEPVKKQSAIIKLSRAELDLADQIAASARTEFFKASAKGRWPTDPSKLRDLRVKLVQALTQDSRIGDDVKIIPAVVKAFYSKRVKEDPRYEDLVELLQDDPKFMSAAKGEAEAPAESDDEDVDGGKESTGDVGEFADQVAKLAKSNQTPEDLASEISSRGPEFADQVAKLLSRGTGKKKAALLQKEEREMKDGFLSEGKFKDHIAERKVFTEFIDIFLSNDLPLLLDRPNDPTGLAGLKTEMEYLSRKAPDIFKILKKAFAQTKDVK